MSEENVEALRRVYDARAQSDFSSRPEMSRLPGLELGPPLAIRVSVRGFASRPASRSARCRQFRWSGRGCGSSYHWAQKDPGPARRAEHQADQQTAS
jgi:hypothetical protein